MKPLRPLLLLATTALSLAPAMGQSHTWQQIHKGNRDFRQGEYRAAGTHYGEVLQAEPSQARALYNQAGAVLMQNAPEQALIFYQQAAKGEQSPLVRSMAYHNRGYIYQTLAGATTKPEERTNHLRSAIAEYKQALRENPQSDASRYNLALCQKQLRESEQSQPKPEPEPQAGNNPQPKPQAGEQSQQQAPRQESQQDTDPLLRFARQAERQTRDKLNQRPQQRGLKKNW